ncbi:Maf-like protein [Vibrio profundum]|uniref:Maf family protein n=1 Tax=Vibrio profundum TaxID=2910247 RepID=UPI003D14D7B9
MNPYSIVLASTSPFRQQLLAKLEIPFTVASPNCDETPMENETPDQLVERLALEKAASCPLSRPSLVIGSDQVCVIDGNIVGKPLTRENAIRQLQQQSGKAITFYTGLAVYNSDSKQSDVIIDTVVVHFRTLSRSAIENYIDKEQPLYCAGSFKCEGLGIALFDRIESSDPNSLIGLPLIRLVDLLHKHGVEVL